MSSLDAVPSSVSIQYVSDYAKTDCAPNTSFHAELRCEFEGDRTDSKVTADLGNDDITINFSWDDSDYAVHETECYFEIVDSSSIVKA